MLCKILLWSSGFSFGFKVFTFIDKHDLNNGVKRHIDHVRAAAVDGAVGGPVVPVAEEVRRQLVHLRQGGRGGSTV